MAQQTNRAAGDDARLDGGDDVQAEDGLLRLRNPHLSKMATDHLYHLALATDTHDLQHMFGDLKHGMGAPSLSILMHEVLKLIHYARCQDVVLIRIGTSGGIGIPPGTVVVSTAAVNGLLKEEVEVHILGEVVRRPCVLDTQLANEIVAVGRDCMAGTNVVAGRTLSSNDFYEGQARLDGAICHYTEDDKFAFLERLRELGVVNIEMESSQFAAMCHHAGVKGAVLCVTLLDRIQGDQVTAPKDVMAEWQQRPQELAIHFMARQLGATLCA
ncbi:uridine phosphorylase 1 isoform X2 [Dermacentor silvarum]|uniref:uridine phosphorylase 1 isoform X2 n=1 Tax=Dermacentor silvarum TaxID=543639 RepID=UPI00210145B1|nr:uridine phosphorylase 1 isoform X2 [Dermacentor silvarum]